MEYIFEGSSYDACFYVLDEISFRLRDDLKSQAEELTALQARHRESQNALTDLNSKLVPLEYKCSKAEAALEHLKKREVEVETELKIRRDEIIDLKRNHSSQTVEVHSQLISAKGELEELQGRMKGLQVENGQIAAQNTAAITMIRDCHRYRSSIHKIDLQLHVHCNPLSGALNFCTFIFNRIVSI